MNKISSIALVSVLVAGLSAPAFAYEVKVAPNSFDADYIVSVLKSQGINAQDAYEAGKDTVRVVVRGADGLDHFAYFDIDSLTPIKGVGYDVSAARS